MRRRCPRGVSRAPGEERQPRGVRIQRFFVRARGFRPVGRGDFYAKDEFRALSGGFCGLMGSYRSMSALPRKADKIADVSAGPLSAISGCEQTQQYDHSKISSARPDSGSGMVMPSPRAVLKLMNMLP